MNADLHRPGELLLPPVYPITDKNLAGKRTHFPIVKELVRGGARLIQIRDKSTPVRDLLDDLRRSADYALEHGVILILNDRCDLVLAGGAGGVHLGQEDLPPEAARRLLGTGRVVGYSTHTLRQVRAARRLPVDYIGFGPVYATSTKLNPSPLTGLDGLRRAVHESARPVVAIGGIGLEQVCEVLETGAASVAVISALMTAPKLARRMDEFLRRAKGRDWNLKPEGRPRG